jgi:hypothetical protein
VTPAENTWIANYGASSLKGTSAEGSYLLIGGTTPAVRAGSPWFWETAGGQVPISYANWIPGQPSYDGPYLVMVTKGADLGKWHDAPIMKKVPFICEKAPVCNDCLKIKKTTLMAILETCGCDK